jgi:hypothetical protein
MKNCYRFLLLAFTAVLLLPLIAAADPCLVVYPAGPCVYHFDPSEYYLVGPGHPYYDAEYDRGGYVLLETGTDEVDLSIYQAPMLEGFEESTEGNDGFFFMSTDFELIVDGFSNNPTTFVNVLIMFDQFSPDGCLPQIEVNYEPVSGYSYEAGDLVVSTPTPHGNNYSDTMTFLVSWRGCYGVRIWAFSDENYNGVRDGNECFTAFSHDISIPTDESTWGEIKTKFDE